MEIIHLNTTYGIVQIKDIKKDNLGYYHEKITNFNFWGKSDIEKLYFNEIDTKKINNVIKYNKNYKEYEIKVKESKESKRVIKVPQKIANDVLNVFSYIYLDENNKQIIAPKKDFNEYI